MDSIRDNLLKIKEMVSKGMKNGGLGGPGSVKNGAAVKPSTDNNLSKPGNNSSTPSTGIKQQTKKNPVKSAEQTHNKDIKDIKMKEAKAKLNENPPEVVKYDDNGQWRIDKSSYPGYKEEDNVRRKAKNIGSEETGIKTMNRVKRYGGSGASAASKEAKQMRSKSKKNPVKTYSKEEIDAINRERGLD